MFGMKGAADEVKSTNRKTACTTDVNVSFLERQMTLMLCLSALSQTMERLAAERPSTLS